MRIADIFGHSYFRDYGDCGPHCDNDFRGRDDPNYFTGLQEARSDNYRQYDDETDLLGLFG
jgi:hypothetical protein